jgi:hypothetical protein
MRKHLWLKRLKGRDGFEEQGVDGKILKRILRKNVECEYESSGSKEGMAGTCKLGSELWSSIKGKKFFNIWAH